MAGPHRASRPATGGARRFWAVPWSGGVSLVPGGTTMTVGLIIGAAVALLAVSGAAVALVAAGVEVDREGLCDVE
ncbi:hypothetical protein GCM10017714_30260 [Curtobacterium pusillum]